MKLLICEYVTAGGFGTAAGQPLQREADAMARALARDFSALPDLEVLLLRCPSLPSLAWPGLSVRSSTDAEAGLAAALPRVDAVLLVAPETGGLLHRLSRAVESSGVAPLGATSAAIARAGDKWLTARALARAGVPQVATFQASADWPEVPGAWVLKPRDGCGCEGIQRFADQAAARAAGASRQPLDGWIAQPWQDGAAISLSVLGSADGAELLSVNRQILRLNQDGTLRLHEVETGQLDDAQGTLARLARAVQDAIPGLRGIYGIDAVLTRDGPRVVEVNPRVTSAYPGLRALAGGNPAQRWLAAWRRDRAVDFGLPSAATGNRPGPEESDGRVASSTARPAAACLGWDLGGAHLKVAALGFDGTLIDVIQRPCALWQGLDRLHPLLAELMPRWGRPVLHAVTMSGEMVDLFADRTAGVRALIEALLDHADGVPIRIYAGADRFLVPSACHGAEHAIASANWLAAGDWAARHLPRGILLDIGSTTTDLLCLADGRAQAAAHSDTGRLASEELVYTGVTRTPLMALGQRVRVAGRWHGLMAELFATSADVYRLLGELPDDADQHPSADGGPKTAPASLRRLARMVGCDGPEYPEAVWRDVAQDFRTQQVELIGQALDSALKRLAAGSVGTAAPAPRAVLAGVGRFLGTAVCAARALATVDFADLGALIVPGAPHSKALREGASRCAPAVAVAALAWSLQDGIAQLGH